MTFLKFGILSFDILKVSIWYFKIVPPLILGQTLKK